MPASDTPSLPSKAALGPHWKGIEELKCLVIFGDSYSDVGGSFAVKGFRDPPTPTLAEPLGYEFPGITWNESGEPNWVGHLITNHLPRNPKLLVYDYAVGGAVVNGLIQQYDLFLDHIGGKAEAGSPWNADDALFVTWVGINDCHGTPEESLERLFLMEEGLYDAGARNFLFINVPPVNRMPCKASLEMLIEWNKQLAAYCERFKASHPDTAILEFSSWDVFNELFDDPDKFGFDKEDVGRRSGAMFVDHIHPTSRVHNVFAEAIGRWLESL